MEAQVALWESAISRLVESSDRMAAMLDRLAVEPADLSIAAEVDVTSFYIKGFADGI